MNDGVGWGKEDLERLRDCAYTYIPALEKGEEGEEVLWRRDILSVSSCTYIHVMASIS